MQISFAVSLLALSSLAVSVTGQFSHMVVLNDDKEDPTKSCTLSELELIKNTINGVTRRRGLGAKGALQEPRDLSEQHQHGRSLCIYGCSSMGGMRSRRASEQNERELSCTTTCPGSMGGMRRRRAAEEESLVDAKSVRSSSKRELKYTTKAECDAKIPAVNLALNTLRDSMAAGTCKNLLSASRLVECAEPAAQCAVTNVDLINATSQTVHTANMPTSGTSFCKSTPISFKASTEFYRGRVNFVLKGPWNYSANRTEVKEPYYMYGNTATKIDGKVLSHTGLYTLQVKSVFEPTMVKTINFTTLAC